VGSPTWTLSYDGLSRGVDRRSDRWTIEIFHPSVAPWPEDQTQMPDRDGQRDPHSPEDAADIVVDELMADRGTSKKLADEAEGAAEEVEEQEDAE
jgi:hypothetical protein